MSGVNLVHLDGGDLGRSGFLVSPHRDCIEAAVRLAVAELATVELDPKPNHKWTYAIEVGLRVGDKVVKAEKIEEMVAACKLPPSVSILTLPGNDETSVFSIYGASGGRAAACIFYLVKQ